MPLPYQLPNPRTWPGNALIKAPYLRQDADNAVALLSAPPMFAGTQATTQAVADSTDTTVTLDTELYDNGGGHQLTYGNVDRYWAQFPGWYLAQGSCAVNYAGGAGIVTAGIGYSLAGSALTIYYGARLPNSGTAGQFAQASVAKLVLLTTTGAYATPNDYVSLAVAQTSGASRNTLLTGGQAPGLQLRWVCAASGTPGLTVPANPAWAVPPAYVTSAFLNANIRDAIRFLIYPPVMEANYVAGTQSLASQASLPTAGTTVQVDTRVFDNYSAFNTTTHTWTAPVAGTYWCYGQAHMNMNVATSVALAAGLTVTSANYNSGTTTTMWGGGGAQAVFTGGGAVNCVTARRRLRLNAGDTVALAAFQNDSGANAVTLDRTAGPPVAESRLIIVWRPA